MSSVTSPVPFGSTQPELLDGFFTRLRARLGQGELDERTVYLSQASDHADLERRIAAWDAQEQTRQALRLHSLSLP